MDHLQQLYPERRDELLEILGVDCNWRMQQLSEGKRHRVYIFLGLLRPFKVLILDEITRSLDIASRQNLLRWLERDSKERNATIIYATHIFDGLELWPTHLHYLTNLCVRVPKRKVKEKVSTKQNSKNIFVDTLNQKKSYGGHASKCNFNIHHNSALLVG